MTTVPNTVEDRAPLDADAAGRPCPAWCDAAPTEHSWIDDRPDRYRDHRRVVGGFTIGQIETLHATGDVSTTPVMVDVDVASFTGADDARELAADLHTVARILDGQATR